MAELKDAVITVTAKQAAAVVLPAVGILVAGIWAVLTLTLGGMQQDVAAIRTSLDAVQADSKSTVKDSHTTETDLRGQLASLTSELRVTNASLLGLTGSVTGLDTSIKAVDQRLADSTRRQQEFERWVVVRLGGVKPEPTEWEIPAKWLMQEGDLRKLLVAGDDPLLNWFKANK